VTRVQQIVVSLFIIIAIAVVGWILFRPHTTWTDATTQIPANTKGVSFNDGPVEIWDAHLSTGPDGLQHIVGIIKNNTSNTITVGEIAVVDGHTVLFDTQPNLTLQPSQPASFVADAQDKKYTEFNDKTLIIGYK
jgi:hypothetical protein